MKKLPSTGFAGFDDNLRAVFDINPEDASAIVKDANGNVEHILDKIDKGVVRAAIALQSKELFDAFARAHPEQLIPILRQAKEITGRIFGSILDDPKKREELDNAIDNREPTTANLENIDAINSVTMTPEWKFNLPARSVIPGLRMSLFNPGEKVLLRTYLDWDDTIYLCYRIIQELLEDANNFELISAEAKKNTDLKDLYGDRVAKRISNMLRDLKDIRSMLCNFGFSKSDFAPD